MMRSTSEPQCARPVYVADGRRATDGSPVNLYVTEHRGVYYATYSLDGATVYRRRYSGRNVDDLRNEVSLLRAGLLDLEEAGPGIDNERVARCAD